MRLGLIPCAVLLCALPARGDTPTLTSEMIEALTPIDATPSRADLDDAFQGSDQAFSGLVAIAGDPGLDLGLVLRAIRALPAYCPPAPQPCGAGAIAHNKLASLIDSYLNSQQTPQTPQNLLRLRAAIEALGATRSGLTADVDQLQGLLTNASRDVRATVVQALGNLCNRAAIAPLTMRLHQDTSAQVQAAIVAALQDLRQCP